LNNYSNYDIKQIPFSLEAEQSVLGAILISPELYEEIAGELTVEDFYLERHQRIFESITDLYLKDKSLDLVTLLDVLLKNTKETESGIKEYLVTLAEFVPRITNIKDYSVIVKEKSLRRKLIDVAHNITDMAYQDASEIDVILDRAEQLIFALAQGKSSQDLTHIKYILVTVFDQIHKIATDKEAAKGLSTGFSSLDHILVGMNPGNLILVGARPGMGKTAFAMNIAVNLAGKNKSVAVFTLEMSKEEIVARSVATEAFVDNYKLRSGFLDEEDWTKIIEASARISNCDIYIDDTADLTVTAMKAKLRQLKKLDLVIIDYLGLMHTEKNLGNRVQEVSEISRNLKIMAKELGVPVILCAQLNRGPESRDDKRPMLADLRDSGAIEQDADVVMFLYRDEYYKESVDKHNRAEIIFAKNRHGSIGKVEVGWEAKYTRFYDLDKIHTEQ